VAASHNMVITNNYYTTSKEGASNIGDIRISFYDNNADTVSVLATQTGNTFTSYTAKSGKSLFRLYEGQYNGEEILKKITDENNILKWALRILGILFVIVGINSLFKPLSLLTGRIPILGSLVGTITGIVSFAVGLAISLVVIAIAWFRFRPVLSILLLAIVALVLVLLRIYTKNKKANNQNNELNEVSNINNSNNEVNTVLNNNLDNHTNATPNVNGINSEFNATPNVNDLNNENLETPGSTNQQVTSEQINNDTEK